MSAIAPIFIMLAVVLPQIALMTGLYLWVNRHRQPDVARIKVFRALLWFIFCIFLGLLAASIILGPPDLGHGDNLLLVISSLLLLAGTTAFQIRICRRRLRRWNAGYLSSRAATF
jgi:hypothetical protein